jgi:hypothetical protein
MKNVIIYMEEIKNSHVELSSRMTTRPMKFFAALLGDGLFDTLRCARPNLIEIFTGIFIYIESDRMGIFKWNEGTIPEKLFESKGEGTQDLVHIRCRCGNFFSERWGKDKVTTFDFRDVNIFDERFCNKCVPKKMARARCSS